MRTGSSARSTTSRSMFLPSAESVSESPWPLKTITSPAMRTSRSQRISPLAWSNAASGLSTVTSGVSFFRSTGAPLRER